MRTLLAAVAVLLLAAGHASRPAGGNGHAAASTLDASLKILARQLERQSRSLLRAGEPAAITAWVEAACVDRGLTLESLAPLLRRRLAADPRADLLLRGGILAAGVPPRPPETAELAAMLRALPRVPRHPASDPAIVGSLPPQGRELVLDARRHRVRLDRLEALEERSAAAARLGEIAGDLRGWMRESIGRRGDADGDAAILLLDLDEAVSLAAGGWDARRAKSRATSTIRERSPRLGPPHREAIAAIVESLAPVRSRFVREVRPLAGDRVQLELGTTAITKADLRRWSEAIRRGGGESPRRGRLWEAGLDDPAEHPFLGEAPNRHKGDWQRFAAWHRFGGHVLFADGGVRWVLNRYASTAADGDFSNDSARDFNKADLIWDPLGPTNEGDGQS